MKAKMGEIIFYTVGPLFNGAVLSQPREDLVKNVESKIADDFSAEEPCDLIKHSEGNELILVQLCAMYMTSAIITLKHRVPAHLLKDAIEQALKHNFQLQTALSLLSILHLDRFHAKLPALTDYILKEISNGKRGRGDEAIDTDESDSKRAKGVIPLNWYDPNATGVDTGADGPKRQVVFRPARTMKRKFKSDEGETVKLYTNCFLLREKKEKSVKHYKEIKMYSYDVKMYRYDQRAEDYVTEPLKTTFEEVPQIMKKAAKQLMVDDQPRPKPFRTDMPIFDKRNLHIPFSLDDLVNSICTVEYTGEDRSTPTKYKLVFARTGVFDFSVLCQLEQEKIQVSDPTEEAYRAMSIMECAIRQYPMLRCVSPRSSSRAFYDPSQSTPLPASHNLISILEVMSGFHTSLFPSEKGLVLNIDTATATYDREVPLLEYLVTKLERFNIKDIWDLEEKWQRPDQVDLKAKLRSLVKRAEVKLHYGETFKNFKRNKLVKMELEDKPTTDKTFQIDGEWISVDEYVFKERTFDPVTKKFVGWDGGERRDRKPDYCSGWGRIRDDKKHGLYFPGLPPATVRRGKDEDGNPKIIRYPLEQLVVRPKISKDTLTGVQTAKMLEVAKSEPGQLIKKLLKTRDDYMGTASNQPRATRDINMDCKSDMMEVKGRELPLPSLLYKDNHRVEFNRGRDTGKWDLVRKEFYEGAKIGGEWVFINAAEDCFHGHDDARNFVERFFIPNMRKYGIEISSPEMIVKTAGKHNLRKLEEQLRDIADDYKRKRDKKPILLVAVGDEGVEPWATIHEVSQP